MDHKMFVVGKVVNTHGVHGEVRVVRITDNEDRFRAGNTLYLVKNNEDAIKLTISGHRIHKQFDLLRFKEFNNINDVEHLKDATLQVKEEQLPPLQGNEFYVHEIIGCQMYTTEGDEIGIIESVLSPGANDVWVVKRPNGKEALIPYIKDVVKKVEIKEKLVIIELMEGLLD